MDMEKCGQCGGSLEACSCRRQACLESAEGEPLVFIDGHDDAILGLAQVDDEPRVVYDRAAIIRKLMRRDGMDEEGAAEFFEYNIASCRIGAAAPCFVTLMHRLAVESFTAYAPSVSIESRMP